MLVDFSFNLCNGGKVIDNIYDSDDFQNGSDITKL